MSFLDNVFFEDHDEYDIDTDDGEPHGDPDDGNDE
jgi:hypothetical protein